MCREIDEQCSDRALVRRDNYWLIYAKSKVVWQREPFLTRNERRRILEWVYTEMLKNAIIIQARNTNARWRIQSNKPDEQYDHLVPENARTASLSYDY
jgi:hypothetical protein